MIIMNHYIYVIYYFFFTSLLCVFHFIPLLLIKYFLKIYKYNEQRFGLINCMIMTTKIIMVCHFTIIFMTQNQIFTIQEVLKFISFKIFIIFMLIL
jgi:hypothetical protein